MENVIKCSNCKIYMTKNMVFIDGRCYDCHLIYKNTGK